MFDWLLAGYLRSSNVCVQQSYLVSDYFFLYFSDGRVDGGYGEWTQWSPCLQTCSPNGGQTIRRSRKCNAPPPMNGGSACVGPSVERVTSCFNKCPSKFFSFRSTFQLTFSHACIWDQFWSSFRYLSCEQPKQQGIG